MMKWTALVLALSALPYEGASAANAINIRVAALNDMEQLGCQIVFGATNSWGREFTRGALDITYLNRNGDVIGTDVVIFDRMGSLEIEQTKTLPLMFRCYELSTVRMSWGELTSINGERPPPVILDALAGFTFPKLNDEVPVNGRQAPSRKQIQIDMPGCAVCQKPK